MRDCFSTYHPWVNAAWFFMVLCGTMTTFHPVLLLTALACGLEWSGRLGGGWRLSTLALLFVTAAVFNPLFSHAGATVLGYFPSGNPLTLESILFGLGAGGMLTAAAAVLGCMARVMTADKWMCLMGRSVPVLSLLCSMTLGFLPQFRGRLAQIGAAQRQVGRQGRDVVGRARYGVRLLGVLMAWGMESGLTTADAMSSRGYGLPGRTAYTNFTLSTRDRQLLAGLATAGVYLALMAAKGALAWRYYPTVKWGGLDAWSLSAFLVWGGVCALPLALDWKEAREWKRIKSKI